ncbi:hypothetical protein GCM10009682_08690 [Luedemannella flava]|uniref:MarR family transcriptional regulator n=1 Tax=Luedemannella flava TaxID=349316 RepID=A0ABP4XRI8_9ACTN
MCLDQELNGIGIHDDASMTCHQPLDALADVHLDDASGDRGQTGIGVPAAARELRLAGNPVSTLINQLTEAGHLCRETDPADPADPADEEAP